MYDLVIRFLQYFFFCQTVFNMWKQKNENLFPIFSLIVTNGYFLPNANTDGILLVATSCSGISGIYKSILIKFD